MTLVMKKCLIVRTSFDLGLETKQINQLSENIFLESFPLIFGVCNKEKERTFLIIKKVNMSLINADNDTSKWSRELLLFNRM